MLAVKNLSKSFNLHLVLSNVSFSMNHGELLVLSGENGSGKSTLLAAVSSMLRFEKGEVELCGIKSKNIKEYSRQVGYCGDQLLLYEQLTVLENLDFWAKLYGANKKQVQHVVDCFALEQFLEKPIKNCSLGMRRAVSLARSLIHQPQLLCWDEPLVALDHKRKELLGEVVKDLIAQGKMVLISTHENLLTNLTHARSLELIGGTLCQQGEG